MIIFLPQDIGYYGNIIQTMNVSTIKPFLELMITAGRRNDPRDRPFATLAFVSLRSPFTRLKHSHRHTIQAPLVTAWENESIVLGLVMIVREQTYSLGSEFVHSFLSFTLSVRSFHHKKEGKEKVK